MVKRKIRGRGRRPYNSWGVKTLYYADKGKIRNWSELAPSSKQRFVDIFGDKTQDQWDRKNGVKFLFDGTGYVVTINELPPTKRNELRKIPKKAKQIETLVMV